MCISAVKAEESVPYILAKNRLFSNTTLLENIMAVGDCKKKTVKKSRIISLEYELNATHINCQFHIIDIDVWIKKIEGVRWKLRCSIYSFVPFESNKKIRIRSISILKRSLILFSQSRKRFTNYGKRSHLNELCFSRISTEYLSVNAFEAKYFDINIKISCVSNVCIRFNNAIVLDIHVVKMARWNPSSTLL